MTADSVRAYLVLEPSEELKRCHASTRPKDAVEAFLKQHLVGVNFEVAGLPSLASLVPETGPSLYVRRMQPAAVVVAINTTCQDFKLIKPGASLLEAGFDDRIFTASHWCAGRDGRGFFGDRDMAKRLMSATPEDLVLAQPANVRVAVFDSGLEKKAAYTIENVWSAASELDGGDLEAVPVAASKQVTGGHGTATVRQIHSLAPDAVYYDFRILAGDRVRSPAAFVSGAIAAFYHLAALMENTNGPWIAVNAWSLFDKSLDAGRGGAMPGLSHTALYSAIENVEQKGADVIFAAGNCGEFCPDLRCARGTRGPESIHGVASLPSVLSVAAVRCDGIWIGSSSEGGDIDAPGSSGSKPDICAPSGFSEVGDANTLNTGTSTACALAAGAIARLRREFPHPSPEKMRQVLCETARHLETSVPRRRIGAGVLDIAKARERLAMV